MLGLLLRGVFLLKESEIRWFYQEGASNIFPDAFERYVAPIPEDERDDLLKAFHKRLTGKNAAVRAEAAAAWARWEGETLSILGPKQRPPRFDEADFLDAFARIECHYFHNKGFFEKDGWLLEQAAKFGDLPGVIVHGRYDVVTPLSSAWALQQGVAEGAAADRAGRRALLAGAGHRQRAGEGERHAGGEAGLAAGCRIGG